MNSLKWVVALSLIGFGAWGYYTFNDQSILLRVVGLCVAAVLGLLTASQTKRGKQFWHFALAAKNELRRVVWPTRQETIQTTMMVIAVVAIVGMILWGVDMVLLKTVAWITGYGGSY